MCENVWVCINVWVCMICFFVWRWRDYIISISSCLSFLLDDEVMFLITLVRKVEICYILWRHGGTWCL